MGMFDEVIVPELWCYMCGTKLKNLVWQTKDGDNLLERYSLEEFFNEHYRLGVISLSCACSKCKRYLHVELWNDSKSHNRYVKLTVEDSQIAMIRNCTSEHPDHKYSGRKGKEPYFWNNWCAICQTNGYPDGEKNPEMTADHIKCSFHQAEKDYQEIMRMSQEED